MKRLIVFIALVLCFGLSACDSKPQLSSANTIHNSQLGFDISLGTDKADIDKKLGDPEPSGGFYVYVDFGLTVAYNEGKAVMLVVTDYVWKSINNASTDITADELKNICGERSTYSSDVSYSYLYNKKSKPVQDKDDATTVIMFSIEDSKVKNYSVVDFAFSKT